MQGNDILAKIVNEQALQTYRNVLRDWFIGEEFRLYDYIGSFLTNYSRLPDHEALRQNGFSLNEDLPHPIEYYLDALTNRYVFNCLNEQMDVLRTAQVNGDLSAVRIANLELQRALTSGVSDVVLTSFQEEARAGIEQARRALYSDLLGITTGYDVLDQLTGGYQSGDIHILVGRPGSGKSIFLLHAVHAAWTSGSTPLLVSLEMTGIQMAMRALSMMAGVDPRLFRTGEITSWTRQVVTEIVDNIHVTHPPFYFLVAETKKTIHDIEAAIQRVNPDIIYIDAGYLLTVDRGNYKSNRRETIAEVIEALKGLALRTNKPIVVTVQFNRNVKTNKKGNIRSNDEMSIEDIGETDVIGQVAYSVLGIHPPSKDRVSQRQRILELLKNRDDVLVKFRTNFHFNPVPNFDFLNVIEDNSGGDDIDALEAEARANLARDGGW